ncbi:hypothetical protein V3471_14710 [Flavobacterium oreochromis]|uniref:hypothetical protein n=1 Tax=Flavobacterium oreochromis TaxID=2906078 RepID=UPI00385DE854
MELEEEFKKIKVLYGGDMEEIILDYTLIVSKYRNSKKKDSKKYKERLSKYLAIIEMANNEIKKNIVI